VLIVLIVVHAGHATRALRLAGGVDGFEGVVLGHRVWRRQRVCDLAWREYRFESTNLLRCERTALFVAETVRELDIELDVEVAKVVVSVRRHSLTADDLDLAGADALAGNDVHGYPSLVQVLNVNLAARKSSQ
jgi:hypothetical protein